MELFALLLLSIPFFYILGIIQLISFFRKKPKDESVLELLRERAKKNPHLTITSFLEELGNNSKPIGSEYSLPKDMIPAAPASQKPQIHRSTGSSFSFANWYTENSINLLLYVGAFLIVSSAAIFVGFQWETISGIIKAFLLTLLSIAFLGFGIWFYSNPKIKTAGVTFIAIASLLIPINGSAWYTFVFKDLNGNPGHIWMVTSLVALITYVFLAAQLKSRFYAYISSLTSLSFALSMVQVTGLSREFYVLGAIASGYALLIAKLFVLPRVTKQTETYFTPLEISSNAIIPGALTYGLYVAEDQNILFSFEAVLSMILTTGFYLIAYYLEKKPWKLVVSQILAIISVLWVVEWRDAPREIGLYLAIGLTWLYLAVSSIFKKAKLLEESDGSLTIALVSQVFIFIFSFYHDLSFTHNFILGLVPGLSGVYVAYLKNNPTFYLLTNASIAISSIIFTAGVLSLNDWEIPTSLLFIFFSAINFALTIYYKKREETATIFAVSSMCFGVFALLLSITESLYLAGNTFAITLMLSLSYAIFKKNELGYIASAFYFLTIFTVLRSLEIELMYYPLVFGSASALMFFCSRVVKESESVILSFSALSAAVITPALFGVTSIGSVKPNMQELYSLITGYSAVAIIAMEGYFRKTSSYYYLASAVALVMYEWQLTYLSVSEMYFYTLPAGLYFLGLSFVKTHKNSKAGQEPLDVIGILLLTLPSFAFSFGDNAIKHTLVLLVVGIGLLATGISTGNKKYWYSGVSAIASAIVLETYEYVFAIPRWILVGTIGMAFLSTAIYLLARRKES